MTRDVTGFSAATVKGVNKSGAAYCSTQAPLVDEMSLAGGYDFSNLFHASITAYSPGSTFLATAHLRRIIIRSTASLSIVRTFQCLGGHSAASSSRHTDNVTIDQLSWSADSLYVMAFSSKASTAWVFGLTDEGNGEGGEVARIGGEGPEGLVRVEWGKGGRKVLAWSDHGVRLTLPRSPARCSQQIRLTVWDLATGQGSCIQHPKSTSGMRVENHSRASVLTQAHSYSPDARYLAVAERHGMKDHIGIYDTQAGYALLRVGRCRFCMLMTALPDRLHRYSERLLVAVWKVHCRA